MKLKPLLEDATNLILPTINIAITAAVIISAGGRIRDLSDRIGKLEQDSKDTDSALTDLQEYTIKFKKRIDALNVTPISSIIVSNDLLIIQRERHDEVGTNAKPNPIIWYNMPPRKYTYHVDWLRPKTDQWTAICYFDDLIAAETWLKNKLENNPQQDRYRLVEVRHTALASTPLESK